MPASEGCNPVGRPARFAGARMLEHADVPAELTLAAYRRTRPARRRRRLTLIRRLRRQRA